MLFRRANPADADAVLTLWKAAEATEGVTDTAGDIRRISEREHVAFILAIVDETVVGSVIATFDGWRGNMYRLATHPDYRRKGIARSLVSEAEKVFHEWGVRRTTALVEKDHSWAVHFWKDAGYVLDEKMSRYVRNSSQPKGGIARRCKPKMLIKVFVQNEAGSNRKNLHNEKTLEYKGTTIVSRAYPYPYGFILGSNASDGCNLDVFVITKRPLQSGQIFECETMALMEQFEDGFNDHNVLAKFSDETVEVTDEVRAVLSDFVLNVFRHVEGKQISIGQFLGAQYAEAHVTAHLERV